LLPHLKADEAARVKAMLADERIRPIPASAAPNQKGYLLAG
jgi:hypothetical protein